ncbi:MAG: hypothetical protein H6905_11700 [Hyphomicrobiales bacterium]|nr:hypothetical protein [Hyphomicrobiales bacterium]
MTKPSRYVTHLLAPCAIAILSAIPSAHIMSSYLHPNTSKTLNAVMDVGEIEMGDAEALDKYSARLPRRHKTALYLDSSGGSAAGGVLLGAYLRQNRIKIVVEGHRVCASACAMAFLGGTDRNGLLSLGHHGRFARGPQARKESGQERECWMVTPLRLHRSQERLLIDASRLAAHTGRTRDVVGALHSSFENGFHFLEVVWIGMGAVRLPWVSKTQVGAHIPGVELLRSRFALRPCP